MSSINKLIERFVSRPNNFSYQELLKVLNYFGYAELQASGSRVRFYNKEIDHSIKLHKPHPQPILKRYQIDLIIEELSKWKFL